MKLASKNRSISVKACNLLVSDFRWVNLTDVVTSLASHFSEDEVLEALDTREILKEMQFNGLDSYESAVVRFTAPFHPVQ